MFRRAITSVQVALMMLVSGPAVATTLSFTAEPYIGAPVPIAEQRNGIITPFDASLGTLTSVEWQVNTQIQTQLTAENVFDQSVSRNIGALYFVDLTGPFVPSGFISTNVVNTSIQDYTPREIKVFDLSVDRVFSGNVISNLGRWTTAHPEPFTTFRYGLREILTVTGGVPAGVLDVESDATLQLAFNVTYHYEPIPVTVIPLPATGWLLLTTLFGLGICQQRRAWGLRA